MFTRRQWMETAAAWSAWPSLRPGPRPAMLARGGDADDEAFWTDVRAQFQLVPESTNLVTVVRGVTPKQTRQAAAAGGWPRAMAVFYVRPNLVEQLPPLFASNGPAVTKYESSGAHPDAHYAALGDGLDFLSRIGIDRIQARLFALTSRWLTRAQRVPQFRTPVTLDPTHCAGLVAWELEGRSHPRPTSADGPSHPGWRH